MWCLSILEHLDVWGELASHKRLFNPPPQFSRLGIMVSLRLIFMFLVCDVHICVLLFVWVGITLYSLASVLCTCISMYCSMSASTPCTQK